MDDRGENKGKTLKDRTNKRNSGKKRKKKKEKTDNIKSENLTSQQPDTQIIDGMTPLALSSPLNQPRNSKKVRFKNKIKVNVNANDNEQNAEKTVDDMLGGLEVEVGADIAANKKGATPLA